MMRIRQFALVVTVLSSLAAAGQDGKTVAAIVHQAKVEITTEKKDFFEGEPIKFRATLTNEGDIAIYIAKSWDYAGGGIAGFFISVKQLSGKPAKLVCEGTADRGVFEDSRSSEQIIKEDFVRLPAGEFVGFADRYQGCAVEHAGTYQISAIYSPNDFNTHKVVPLSNGKNLVLTERVYSKPFTFRVHAAKKATHPQGAPGS
jgi:hypothetical protein